MSLIITATDFSVIANNAVHYSCKLAQMQNAELMIIHSYTLSVAFIDARAAEMTIEEAKNIAEENMDILVRQLNSEYPGLKVSGKILYGDVIDNIEELCGENKIPWMVVVGNSIAGDNISWIESKMIQAFRNLKYPVLGIPPDCKYKDIRRLCFTYDNEYKGAEIALNQLKDIASNLNAELHVLYAQKDVLNRDNMTEINSKAIEILKRVNPHYHVVYNSDIVKAVKTFLETHLIDWLIVMPRQHSFLESIFHKSNTKAIAHNINLPIVALHEQL